MKDLQVVAEVVRVDSYDTGIGRLLDRTSDALFGERAILLDAARRHPSSSSLIVLDRLFTNEPVALALPRDDERFRLLVDGVLSGIYASGEINMLYAKWFGELDQDARTFFRWNTLSD
jgi:polar amino acid transport system substrate-binding protein